MPEITFQQAKEFLNNITSKDKIAIIHHNDLDGFASGILFYNWSEKKGAKVENFIATYKEWNKENNLEKFNKIIITDIAPNGIEEFNLPKNKEIFYTDHHPKLEEIPKEILAFQTADEGYIPSSRTAGELTEEKPWLALAGTIADAGDLYPENNKYIKDLLEKDNLNLEEFSQKITHIISNTIIFFGQNPQEAFNKIKGINSIEEINKLEGISEEIEKDIKEQMKNIEKNSEKISNINLVMPNPKFSIRGILINKLSRATPNEIFIFLSPKKSNPTLYGISSRHQSDKADLPTLLRAGTRGLESANAGGHKRAAGGQIQIKDLKKFKENLKNYIEDQ